jgi:hypothetical protein
MKIELEKNTCVHDGDKAYGPGGIHDIRDDLAHTLLKTGSAVPVQDIVTKDVSTPTK